MKAPLLLTIVATIALAGCKGGLQGQVVGTWKYDTTTLAIPGVTDDMKKQMSESIRSLDSARIEFKSDGTCAAIGMGFDVGKWKLNGHSIVIKGDSADGAKAVPDLTIAEDGAKIHMSRPMPGGTAMTVDLVRG